MSYRLFTAILILTFCFVVAIAAQAQKPIKSHSTIKGLNCSACHECTTPSSDNPCLKLGAQFFLGEGERLIPAKFPPEFVVINTLEEKYEPVKFPHKKHLHMADNTLDCTECHHYTPVGRAENPPCKECHNPDEFREDLEQVGLNAAYHRRCLSCHVEWSKNTNCELCHASKDPETADKLAKLLPQFREAKEPEKKVFVNRMFTGPYVTFFHTFHSKKKNVYCADCHEKWTCITCHYQGEFAPTSVDVVTGTGVHGTCRLCHETIGLGTCEKCHETEEKQQVSTK